MGLPEALSHYVHSHSLTPRDLPAHYSRVQDRLVFVISPPRAGSTLLQRMLGAHPEIFTHPEPHLITPLAYLGYHDRVDKAPYDHINGAAAIQTFVANLAGGEQDYLDALQAYANTMYGRMLKPSGKQYFLDKTPAYALVLPFLTKLYPDAKYVVLTRHPLAVFSSYANSFFNGDWQEAHRYNPIVERYVPAMAGLLRSASVPMIHVGYEDLVSEPELHLERIFSFLGVPHEPGAVNYGKTGMQKGMGDPINVQKHSRPTTASLHKWAAELNAQPHLRDLAEQMLKSLSDEDLSLWGYDRHRIFEELHKIDAKNPKRVLNNYTFQRRVMLAIRKQINDEPTRRAWVERVRYYCDVVLRDTL